MSSLFQYGGFQHEDSEVSLATMTYQKRLSPRGKRLSNTVTMTVWGEIVESTSDLIIQRAAQIVSAYGEDYKTARMTINGTTAHELLNDSADCISGVKVVGRSFPKDDPAELATVRTFSLSLQATYDAVEDDLVSWQESVSIIGTGGPRFFIIDSVQGPSTVYLTNRTVQYYHQIGEAVGYTAHPAAPGPVGGLEFQESRRITRISGRNMGKAIRFYTTKWSYLTGNDPQGFGAYDPFPTSK